MPALRHRQQILSAELQAIADQTHDRTTFLRLAETLTAFLARLRSMAETLSVIERQKIVRLLVKDVLVGEDTITIRHSIPIPSGPPQNGGSKDSSGRNYLLCTRGDLAHSREPLPALRLGSLGGAVAEEASARRCHHRALCRRRRAGVRASSRSRAFPGRTPGTSGGVRAGTASGEDAPD